MNTDLTYFEWLGSHPMHLAQFGGLTKGYAESRPAWIDYFPTQSLFKGENKNWPVMVDGGGAGQDIARFLAKHPEAAGRLFLQDLPEVLETTKCSDAISKMTHDYFQPQPVHNARVYFVHSILHNWPDDKAREILNNLLPAMRKGYSKLLVNEDAPRAVGPTQMSTSLDMVMMSLFGAAERTEE